MQLELNARNIYALASGPPKHFAFSLCMLFPAKLTKEAASSAGWLALSESAVAASI